MLAFNCLMTHPVLAPKLKVELHNCQEHSAKKAHGLSGVLDKKHEIGKSVQSMQGHLNSICQMQHRILEIL